jgi:hypothetical protein
MEIYTKSGQVIYIDNEDYYLVKDRVWHITKAGYAANTLKKRERTSARVLLMHRLIMQAPANMEVDHVNGNPLDNRKENMRLCTHHQNMMNKATYKNNKSGYKGVSWHKPSSKWVARIKSGEKYLHLGLFHDVKDAYNAYLIAAKHVHQGFNRYAK